MDDLSKLYIQHLFLFLGTDLLLPISLNAQVFSHVHHLSGVRVRFNLENNCGVKSESPHLTTLPNLRVKIKNAIMNICFEIQ